MSETPSTQPAGWYYAQGDPPGTQRFWDGAQWQGSPQPIPGSEAALDGAPSNLGQPISRIGARLIDWILWIMVSVLVAQLLDIPLVPANADDVPDYGPNLAYGLVTTIIIAAYEVVLVAQRGATVGKMALGLRVTTVDGAAPDVKVAALRIAPYAAITVLAALLGPTVGGLLGLLTFIIGLVSLVFLFTDKLRQTVWDKVAKTIVVSTR